MAEPYSPPTMTTVTNNTKATTLIQLSSFECTVVLCFNLVQCHRVDFVNTTCEVFLHFALKLVCQSYIVQLLCSVSAPFNQVTLLVRQLHSAFETNSDPDVRKSNALTLSL